MRRVHGADYWLSYDSCMKEYIRGGPGEMRTTLLALAVCLAGCASTIPRGAPSATVPLGVREFADFVFEVSPPPKDDDIAACRVLAKPGGEAAVGTAGGIAGTAIPIAGIG